MAIFDYFYKSRFGKWVSNASDEELSNGYEERRQQWLKNDCGGDGQKSYEMRTIENEISERAEKKWKNNPNRNTDPNFRWTDKNRWDKD